MSPRFATLLKVCILILNWNGWKDTIKCLESTFRNTYPNYQVVVIDNGSTNNSIERIKAWTEREINIDLNANSFFEEIFLERFNLSNMRFLHFIDRRFVFDGLNYICYRRF